MKEKEETAGKTAKTVKVNDIVTAYRLINPAKLTKMETAERFALILATRRLRKVDADFQELMKDTQEKMKPEGFDAIMEKLQGKRELTATEQDALNRHNRDVTKCAQTELDREAELDFEPLGKEALDRFFESNDFSVEETMAIMDVIGE